ncbi:MAG: carbohydrate kinase [Polyangiaceae bacterium]
MTGIACFGEVLWDVFQIDSDDPTRFVFELGGAPANVASTLGKLGCNAYIVGSVGRDRFGRQLTEKLERDGVDCRYLAMLPERTGLAFVFRDEAGEPSFLFYRRETADMSYRAGMLPKRFPKLSLALVGTSTSVDDELREATHVFLERAQKAGAEVVLDLNVRAHLWSSRAAMLRETRNLAASAALIKASSADLEALGKDVAWLKKVAPRAVVVLTRGKGAAEVLGPFGRIAVPTKPRKVVDATGAGDAFLSGIFAAHAAAQSSPIWERTPAFWKKAVSLGHLLAAQAVSSAGATSGIKRLAQARRFLEELRP